jgi:cyclic-di-AMP phosphodiesterase PgpH
MMRAHRISGPRAYRLVLGGNALGLTVVLAILLTVQPNAVVAQEGQVAATTIVADHRATYVDVQATNAKRQQVEQGVAPIYQPDTRTAPLHYQQAALFLSRAGSVIGSAIPVVKKLTSIRSLVTPPQSPTELQQLGSLDTASFKDVQAKVLALLSQAETWRFDSNQIESTEIALLSTLPPRLPTQERNSIGEILSTFIAPTLVPNLIDTNLARKVALRHFLPVRNTIVPNEVIVRRGDMVTKDVIEKINALGLATQSTDWRNRAASILFTAIVLALLFWYMHAFHSAVLHNPRLLFLIDASLVISVAAVRFTAAGHVLLPYFIPLAAISTFGAVLIAPEACIALTLAMALLAGWAVTNSFDLAVYYFVAGAAGVLAVRQIRQIKQFFIAGAGIALFAEAAALAFGLTDNSYDLIGAQEHAMAALFNGVLSASLALGAFALLSGFFGVTSTIQLYELASPSHTLLRRLMQKAPGTYNHSVILASMVEGAAEEIGANSLAARLGALYHDIGKTANPHAFVENQFGIGNIHDELDSFESARLILAHVSQGVRLARQYKLPDLIVSAVTEHHGTMTIAYFLRKAETASDFGVDQNLFMYPGPKPRSKETGLLMLADGCESAVRAAAGTSFEAIRQTVQRIFDERVAMGQLDESPLTIRDLHEAQGAFCSVLNGLYHPRIEYPEPGEVVVGTRSPLEAPVLGNLHATQ